MKAGDLIRFKKTGVLGVVVEVREPKKNHEAPEIAGPSALVYHAHEDEETGIQNSESLWYYLDYLHQCAELVTVNLISMAGGKL
jgi:3-keto-L-gulonate-6-phosphate decarboxylase